MEPENKKSLTPPYLGIGKLEELIDLASNRSYSEFTPSIFKNRGFSIADAFLAINTLKFLDLIDDSGKPTDYMPKIGQKGDARKKIFEEIIKKAYKKLFDVVEAPQDLPVVELFNEMKMQYSLSPRVARQAVPAFLKISEFAGLKEEGSIVGRKRSTDKTIEKDKSVVAPKSKTAVFEPVAPSGLTIIEVVKNKVAIGIPSGSDQKALLNKDFRKYLDEFIDAARIFANSVENEVPKSEQDID